MNVILEGNMINRIIGKILCIIGGIAGSIFSIVKLSEAFETLDGYNYSLERNKSALIFSAVAEIRADINELHTHMILLGILLVISIIVFIIGFAIKVNTDKSNH